MGIADGAGGFTAGTLRPVGNVNEFTLNPTEQFYEHNENETGKQYMDLRISNRIMATASISFESLVKENLRDLLQATITTVTGAAVTAESHTAGGPGTAIKLANLNVTTWTSLTDGTTSYTRGTDYIITPPSNIVYFPTGSTVANTDVVEANYTAGNSTIVNAFRELDRYYYLLFDGIDKVSNERFQLEMFKVSLDPATGIQLITDEVIRTSVNSTLLYEPAMDTTDKPYGGFFRWGQAAA